MAKGEEKKRKRIVESDQDDDDDIPSTLPKKQGSSFKEEEPPSRTFVGASDAQDSDDEMPLAQLGRTDTAQVNSMEEDSDDNLSLSAIKFKALAKKKEKPKLAKSSGAMLGVKKGLDPDLKSGGKGKGVAAVETPSKKGGAEKKSPSGGSGTKGKAALATKKKTASASKGAGGKGSGRGSSSKDIKEKEKKKSKSTGVAKKRRTKDPDTGGSGDKLVTSSSVLYQTVKGEMIAKLLCRWWYAMEWPKTEDIIPAPAGYEALDGYPGVYICIEGDNIGKLLDNRSKEDCPCYTNLSKKSSEELKELLETALTQQKEEYLKHWGEDTEYEKYLVRELKWLKAVVTSKADKAAEKALRAAKINN